MSKEISASIIFADTAQEIWLDLKDRFQQSNGPRIFQLRRELITHCQGQTSVSVYFKKLNALWEELNNFRPHCVCGKCCEGVKKLELFHRMDYVLNFLMGLNKSFAQVRSQILLIVQEERQLTISSRVSTFVSSNDMAFAVKNTNNKDNFSNFSARNVPVNRGNFTPRGADHNRNDSNFRGGLDKNRFSNMNQNRERPFLHRMSMDIRLIHVTSYMAIPLITNQGVDFNSILNPMPSTKYLNNQVSLLLSMTIFSRAWTKHNMTSSWLCLQVTSQL